VLATYAHGEATPGTRPLIIAHGLYGSGRNWGVIARNLSEHRAIVTVDMRNHGSSPWTDTHTYADMAADLADVIAANGGTADLLGHSMGGKAAMWLALTQPDLVARLIVADIAPVTYTHSQLPFIHAMRGVDLAAIKTRGDADRQLRGTVPELAVRAFLVQSLDVVEKRWRLNLDTLERDMAGIMTFPATSARYDRPTLFLSGGNSDYVRPEHRPHIKTLFPAAKFVKIPGASHWLHAEKPREFEAAVTAWLAV